MADIDWGGVGEALGALLGMGTQRFVPEESRAKWGLRTQEESDAYRDIQAEKRQRGYKAEDEAADVESLWHAIAGTPEEFQKKVVPEGADLSGLDKTGLTTLLGDIRGEKTSAREYGEAQSLQTGKEQREKAEKGATRERKIKSIMGGLGIPRTKAEAYVDMPEAENLMWPTPENAEKARKQKLENAVRIQLAQYPEIFNPTKDRVYDVEGLVKTGLAFEEEGESEKLEKGKRWHFEPGTGLMKKGEKPYSPEEFGDLPQGAEQKSQSWIQSLLSGIGMGGPEGAPAPPMTGPTAPPQTPGVAPNVQRWGRDAQGRPVRM